MCGFYGEISIGDDVYRPPTKAKQERISRLLKLRGPDHYRCHEIPNTGFMCQSRLSIVDQNSESAGPIVDQKTQNILVYNGEIYNCIDLKKKLIPDLVLSNKSDTILLSTLLNFNFKNIVEHLDGIFAFAFYNPQQKKLLLAVDSLGVKPLYYKIENRNVTFSSDFRLLIPDNFSENDLDPGGVTSYFALRYATGNKTVIKGIKKLLPGEMIEVTNEKINRIKYWQPLFNINYTRTSKEWIELLNQALISSLDAQYAKVPSAVMLSGGFDSSTLVGGFRYLQKQISTFSCFYTSESEVNLPLNNHDFNVVNHITDESRFTEQIISQFGVNHTVYNISKDDLNKFLAHIAAMGEPMASIDAFGNYCFASRIPNKYKVLYSGVGNDELYGGYTDIYFGKNGCLLNSAISGINYIKMLSDPTSQSLDLVNCLVPEMINLDYAITEFDNYLSNFGFNSEECINHTALMFLTAGDLPWWELKQADAMYMAFGIEVRVPFLSKEMVNLALQIPSKFKYEPGIDKVILKKAFHRYVPESVINRAKCPSLGFPVEMFNSRWFQELLNAQLEKDYSCFKRDAVLKQLEAVKQCSMMQYYDLCYRYVIFCLWLESVLLGQMF